MKPKTSPCHSLQRSLIYASLSTLVNPGHPLVKLADTVDWRGFDEDFTPLYSADVGAPGKPIRLMLGLTYLKHLYNVSDEKVVVIWSENPYWQYFCGGSVLAYDSPIDPSLLSRWRKRVSQAGMEPLLKEAIAAGLKRKENRPRSSTQVKVDATVLEKDGGVPPRGKFFHAMLKKLTRLADKWRGV